MIRFFISNHSLIYLLSEESTINIATCTDYSLHFLQVNPKRKRLRASTIQKKSPQVNNNVLL